MRNQLILYVFGFIAMLLLFIYLFQVVFLQDFYSDSQKNNMVIISDSIVSRLDEDNLEAFIVNQARNNNVCIRVISMRDNEISASSIVGCSLNNLENNEIQDFAQKAIDNGGSYLNETNQSLIIKVGSYRDYISNENTDVIINDVNNMTYTTVTGFDTDNPVIIMVNAQISPVNSTVDTLRSQFVFIALIGIIIAIVLAVALSRRFIRPLELINTEVENLPSGSYDGTRVKASYEEAVSLNNTLVESSLMIQAADKAKSNLIGNVSHDLRTPLTMIAGYSEMMRDLPGENNKENAQIIIDESKRLSSLVSDLLDLSKLQDNNIKLYKSKISIKDLLTRIYKQYRGYCSGKDIELKLIVTKDIFVEIDSKRINQVLYNFINNAINYGNKENLKITIKQTMIDGNCLIEVIDNGEGIEENKLKLIWDRYYKISEEHKRVSAGSGIGLAISKEILELHKFEYGAKSKVELGSNFYFKIPKMEKKDEHK